MFPEDSVCEHIADTLSAGAGLCNRAAVEVLCSEGPERIRDLIRLGVTFDRNGDELARGLESAHSHARVLHAGGDATGLTIETALVKAVRAADVEVLEHTFASDLLVENERVVGLEILDGRAVRRQLLADAVILASGGAGQLFLHTTNPAVATGDGVAMAWRAGAQLADVEFYQFHPTALAAPGTFLISEAVRGEGAVLLDQGGGRFMQALHPNAELAPRDVVARGIARQMAKQGGAPVMLDATKMGAEFLRRRFPNIDAACRTRGLDWAREPIPVTPAAHYWMGGVRTDLWGRTSLPGLFAVGEAACTGAHGANRLASNSLLESVVFASRCARLLLGEVERGVREASFSTADPDATVVEVEDEGGHPSQKLDRTELRRLIWDAAGIERNGTGLWAAAERLAGWSGGGRTVQELETANLLTLARVLLAAALAREESRGAHFREDFPESSGDFQRSLMLAKRVAVPC
jgi:L-aspartate oxidase